MSGSGCLCCRRLRRLERQGGPAAAFRVPIVAAALLLVKCVSLGRGAPALPLPVPSGRLRRRRAAGPLPGPSGKRRHPQAGRLPYLHFAKSYRLYRLARRAGFGRADLRLASGIASDLDVALRRAADGRPDRSGEQDPDLPAGRLSTRRGELFLYLLNVRLGARLRGIDAAGCALSDRDQADPVSAQDDGQDLGRRIDQVIRQQGREQIAPVEAPADGDHRDGDSPTGLDVPLPRRRCR